MLYTLNLHTLYVNYVSIKLEEEKNVWLTGSNEVIHAKAHHY